MIKSVPPNEDEALPNAGVDDAPKAGMELPKAGADEAPKAGVDCCPKTPVDVPPKIELPVWVPKGLRLPKGLGANGLVALVLV